MTMWHLARREIRHRSGSFLLGVIAVSMAAGVLAGALSLLRAHDHRTTEILEEKERALGRSVCALEDDIRRSMLHLGFNIVILPKNQNLSDWYADDYAANHMPEGYVDRLEASDLLTIEHLVPCLRAKIDWPEQQWTIILVGTAATITRPSSEASELAPESIPSGEVVLGHEIHSALGFKVGATMQLKGRTFRVRDCRRANGTKDDITIWASLQDVQSLLDKEGMINEILALECRAAWRNLPAIRQELARILPDVQVVEKASATLARTHARTKVEAEGRAAIERERRHRDGLRESRRRMAFFLVAIATLICVVWTAHLATANVRDRRQEIGILLTLGCRSGQILWLLLARSAIMGLAGGCAGFLLGCTIAAIGSEGTFAVAADPVLFGVVMAVAVGVSVVTGSVPASRASQQDPARTINEQ